MRDELVVYWSPAPFNPEKDSWSLLYPEPKNIYTEAIRSKTKTQEEGLKICPSFKGNATRLFSFNSSIHENIDFSDMDLEDIDKNTPDNTYLTVPSRVGLRKDRNSSIEGHVNLTYNLSWSLFAEEPVVARMTSPYFPNTSPTKNSLLAFGEFDIGQWFRPFNLDYHIPYGSSSFEISPGDPLFFLELFTDKKIVFKRFVQTERMFAISREMAEARSRYARFSKLTERYHMFRQAKMREIVLAEIKKNLVE